MILIRYSNGNISPVKFRKKARSLTRIFLSASPTLPFESIQIFHTISDRSDTFSPLPPSNNMLEIARYSGIDLLILVYTLLVNITEIYWGAAEIRSMTLEKALYPLPFQYLAMFSDF
jgi:hypothetical protein